MASSCESPSAVIAMCSFSRFRLMTVMLACRSSRFASVMPLQSTAPDRWPSSLSSASVRTSSPSEPAMASSCESPSAVMAMCSRSRCLLMTVMLARRSSSVPLQSAVPETVASSSSFASTRSASPSEPAMASSCESPSAVIAMCSRSRCLLLTVMLARRSV